MSIVKIETKMFADEFHMNNKEAVANMNGKRIFEKDICNGIWATL